METRKMKLALSAGALALSLALAGCGGGGSPQAAGDMMDEGPTPAELATTANGLLDTAKTAVDAVMDDSDEATVTAADMAVSAAVGAVAAASEADNHAMLAQRLGQIQGSLTAKKTSRTAAMEAADKTQMMADAAAAGKLYMAAIAGAERFVEVAGATSGALPNEGTLAVMHGDAAKVTVVDNPALAKATGEHEPGQVWSSTMVSAAAGAAATDTKDTVVVYTNIAAPKRVNAAAMYDGTTLTDDPTNVMGMDFGTGNSTKAHDDGAKVKGTLIVGGLEVMGTYECGSACTSQTGAGNKGVALGGTWTFKPEVGAVAGMPDGDYSYFGWWLRETGAATARQYAVSAFQGGAGSAATAATITGLKGTANYEGPAVGKYAMVDGHGGHTGGHFAATASLTADFDKEGRVTGMIHKFDGMDDWKVMLDSAPTGTGKMAVWHIGENKGMGVDSTFMREFREAPSTGDTTPMTLTGTWKTPYDPNGTSVGHMIGAFGATKQ